MIITFDNPILLNLSIKDQNIENLNVSIPENNNIEIKLSIPKSVCYIKDGASKEYVDNNIKIINDTINEVENSILLKLEEKAEYIYVDNKIEENKLVKITNNEIENIWQQQINI